MKLFIAIISFLFGVIIGTAITAFFVIKKNPVVQNFLCSEIKSGQETAQSPFSMLNLLNSSLGNNTASSSALIGNLQEKISENLSGAKPSEQTKAELEEPGPGGCKTEDECLKYCSNLEHLQECLNFVKTYIK